MRLHGTHMCAKGEAKPLALRDGAMEGANLEGGGGAGRGRATKGRSEI